MLTQSWISGENDIKPQRSMKIKMPNNSIRILETGRVNKVSSPGIFIPKMNGNKHGICFYNMPYRHDSACVIQIW